MLVKFPWKLLEFCDTNCLRTLDYWVHIIPYNKPTSRPETPNWTRGASSTWCGGCVPSLAGSSSRSKPPRTGSRKTWRKRTRTFSGSSRCILMRSWGQVECDWRVLMWLTGAYVRCQLVHRKKKSVRNVIHVLLGIELLKQSYGNTTVFGRTCQLKLVIKNLHWNCVKKYL